jgi:GNAT superfamily N-acetyltransferase
VRSRSHRARGTIRAAAPGDAPAIGALIDAAFAHYLERIGRRPAPMDRDHAANAAAGEAWVLEQDDAAVGTVVLRDHGAHLEVDDLAVEPGRQGQGLGGALLRFAEERAWALGRPELRLCTNELMHENRAMYAKLGWEQSGRGEQERFRRVFFRKPARPLRRRDLESAACALLGGGGALPAVPVERPAGEAWTAVAAEVEPFGRAGAVTYVRAGSAITVLCGQVRGEWQELLVDGDAWEADPAARPATGGLAWTTTTFGAGLRGDPDRVVAAMAGVAAADVDRLEVTADGQTRAVPFSPATGAFALAIPCLPHAAFDLVARDAGGAERDRVSYRAPD